MGYKRYYECNKCGNTARYTFRDGSRSPHVKQKACYCGGNRVKLHPDLRGGWRALQTSPND